MKKTVIFAIFLSLFFFGCMETTTLVSSGTFENEGDNSPKDDSDEAADDSDG